MLTMLSADPYTGGWLGLAAGIKIALIVGVVLQLVLQISALIVWSRRKSQPLSSPEAPTSKGAWLLIILFGQILGAAVYLVVAFKDPDVDRRGSTPKPGYVPGSYAPGGAAPSGYTPGGYTGTNQYGGTAPRDILNTYNPNAPGSGPAAPKPQSGNAFHPGKADSAISKLYKDRK